MVTDKMRDQLHGFGHRRRDFDDGDATPRDGVSRKVCVLSRRDPDSRNYADFLNDPTDFSFGHN
jgi:hypothetical protein